MIDQESQKRALTFCLDDEFVGCHGVCFVEVSLGVFLFGREGGLGWGSTEPWIELSCLGDRFLKSGWIFEQSWGGFMRLEKVRLRVFR